MGCVLLTSGPAGAQEAAPRPPEQPFLDAPALLGATFPATWVHDFGTPGWPDGWSPFGLDPGQVPLELDGIPFDDPVTGRPDYELLPFEKLASLDRTGLLLGRAEGVSARSREFATARPLTELVYRSTSNGLQQVSVVHAQQRGSGTHKTRYLWGYRGAGSRGEYPGSRLRRKRQVLFSVRRRGLGMEWEAGTLFNRHRVGAHSGVEPFAGYAYESIYQRIGAEVGDEDARRQSSRNDAFVRVGLPSLGTRLQGWWTLATLTYRQGSDTTAARTSRLGLRLDQPIRLRSTTLRITLEGHTDAHPSRRGWLRTPATRTETHAYVGSEHHLGAAAVSWKAGMSAVLPGWEGGDTAGPGYALDVSWESGPVRPFIRSRNGLVTPSASDMFGFGPTALPLRERVGAAAFSGRSAVDEIGVDLRLGWLSGSLGVAATRTSDGVVRVLDATSDTLTVVPYAGTRSRTLGTARLGLREFSKRGLYFWAQASGSTTAGDDPDLDKRIRESIPEVFGSVALGVRGVLFKGDLDGDFSLRVRGWTAHRGLRFHPETGLLALPVTESRPMEGSLILDIVGVARIRTATLTVSLENILSGTVAFPGNQLVPDYPYPERRLRFSVFWPIFD